MDSADREILISINGRLERIEARLTSLELTTRDLAEETHIAESRIEILQHSIYWGFAIMGLIFAFVGIFVPSLTAIFTRIADTIPGRERHSEYDADAKIRKIIQDELSRTQKQ